MEWRSKKKLQSFSESVFLAYLKEQAETKKPSTMWATYSMLRSIMLNKHNIDLRSYPTLSPFLKETAKGYKPTTSKHLTADQINKFLDEAPDQKYLGMKVTEIKRIF